MLLYFLLMHFLLYFFLLDLIRLRMVLFLLWSAYILVLICMVCSIGFVDSWYIFIISLSRFGSLSHPPSSFAHVQGLQHIKLKSSFGTS